MGLGSKEGERPAWWGGMGGGGNDRERDIMEHLRKWKEINHIYMPATNLYPAFKHVQLLSSFLSFSFFFFFFFLQMNMAIHSEIKQTRHMEPFSDNIFWKRILKMMTKLKLDVQWQKTLHCTQMHWLLCTTMCVHIHLHASVLLHVCYYSLFILI